MNVAPFFGQKATFEQQLSNPGARGFVPAHRSRAGSFQIFILHEAGNSGHRGKQCRIGEMTRRLGLALDHFPLSHSNSSPLATTGSGVPSFSSSLFTAPWRDPPAGLRQKTRFGGKFSFGDFQFSQRIWLYRVGQERIEY